MVKKDKLKTARCIIYRGSNYFLVMHHTRIFSGAKRWAFPGGRIERGEAPEAAVIRELREELYVTVSDLQTVGDYRYKGHDHRVFATEFANPIQRFDRSELRKIGWHSLQEIREFQQKGRLHAGFELDAILDFEASKTHTRSE